MNGKFLIHPGVILREDVLEPNNLTVTEAAKLLGVTRANLSFILNKKRGISPNMAIRISMVFGGTPDVWLRLQNKYDLIKEQHTLDKETLNLKKFNMI